MKKALLVYGFLLGLILVIGYDTSQVIAKTQEGSVLMAFAEPDQTAISETPILPQERIRPATIAAKYESEAAITASCIVRNSGQKNVAILMKTLKIPVSAGSFRAFLGHRLIT